MIEKNETAKANDTTMDLLMNSAKLMSQLNIEGKSMALEYMEYLISTGKYADTDNRGSGRIPVLNSVRMA